MQQLNQIIIEGKVTDVTEDNEWIAIEHDSIKGPPVCIGVTTKHIYNIDSWDLKGKIIRVVGKLIYNNHLDYLNIDAEHLEIHP